MTTSPNRWLTIVMYHFVRDLERSEYPDIKGLSLEQFHGQIDYLLRYYQVVDLGEVIGALTHPRKDLPPQALLLTFDDGYRDHFENVFPVLLAKGLTGCFFPPARAVVEHRVLDVNKIHFILASVRDKGVILDSIFALVDEARGEFPVKDRSYYVKNLAHPSRFDTADVILIKRLLQRELPETLRARIVGELFTRYVTRDEATFSQSLYMNLGQIREMGEAGMHIGSHGFDHYWLDRLSEGDQAREVELSLRFLETVQDDFADWSMAYPYGAHNDSLVSLLRKRGCKAGFTTEVRIADLDSDDPLTLPRLDTNDLPKTGDAEPNEWTLQVLGDGGAPDQQGAG